MTRTPSEMIVNLERIVADNRLPPGLRARAAHLAGTIERIRTSKLGAAAGSVEP